ncbi:MAG: glycosyltransferase family 2 protein [Candidatus Eisenbacteria bacterium]
MTENGARADRKEGAISVVIPTHRRAATLRKVMPTYLGQQGVKEILVVHDPADDGTEEFVRDLSAKDPRVRYIGNPRPLGLPGSRNAGVDHAGGTHVLFGEDDLEFGPGYAEKLLACLEKRGASIAGGRIVYPFPGESHDEALRRTDGPPREERLDPYRLIFDTTSPAPGPMRVPFIHAISLIRRDVFDDVRFDDAYRGGAYREETDFYLRATRAGHEIDYCPEAVCFHLPREVKELGGCMSDGIWAHKYWVLRNNWRFLRRNHGYLRNQGIVRHGRLTMMLFVAATELPKIGTFYLRRYAPGLYTALAKRIHKRGAA